MREKLVLEGEDAKREERERERARAGGQCAARKKSAENWAEFATTKFYCSYCVVVLWS